MGEHDLASKSLLLPTWPQEATIPPNNDVAGRYFEHEFLATHPPNLGYLEQFC